MKSGATFTSNTTTTANDSDNNNNKIIAPTTSSRKKGQQQQQLDPVTLSYYETELQSFNLLEPVLNPHGGSSNQYASSLWTTLLKSELLGGEGELEEYDPSSSSAEDHTNPILELEKYVADFSSSIMGDYASYWNSSSTTTTPSSGITSTAIGATTTASSTPIPPQPEMIAKLDLNDFHRFIGQTGPLSTKFVQRRQELINENHIERQQQLLEELQEEEELMGETEQEHDNSGTSDVTSTKKKNKTQQFLLNKQNFPQLLACEEFLPDLFFSTDFNLADPHTFEQLMSHLDDKFHSSSSHYYNGAGQYYVSATGKKNKRKKIKNKQRSSNEPPTLSSSASAVGGIPLKNGAKKASSSPSTIKSNKKRTSEEWKILRQQLRQQKSALQTEQLTLLTQYLDSVEISLLEQVRSKSHAYFTETTRFAELKTLVKEGCEQVLGLRSTLVELLLCNVEDVERIPKDAFERNALDQLSHLLDLVDNVVAAKACVAGLISTANDEDARNAIIAIRGARTLFSNNDQDNNQEQQQKLGIVFPRNNKYALGKLRALANVDKELGEYEKIVVDSLSNKLVDLFLAWDESNTSDDHLLSSSSSKYMSQLDSLSWRPSNTSESIERQAMARDLINSLVLCNKLSETNALYTDRLCDVIKTTVKTAVQECIADAILLKQQQQQFLGSIASSVSNMTFDQFMECLDMLFEQILEEIRSALSVSRFLRQEGIILRDNIATDGSNTISLVPSDAGSSVSSSLDDEVSSLPVSSSSALSMASELAHKSIAELLRIKKDAHSLIALEQMQRLWDACLAFTVQLENLSGTKAYGLRSTLLAQTKAFVERKHENNMTALVAALDCEKWSQCDVSAERQASLTRLCAGRAVLSTASLSSKRLSKKAISESIDTYTSVDPVNSNDSSITSSALSSSRHDASSSEAEVEGTNYKVVWSCLLLVEMVLSDVSCAAHFQTLATNMISKAVELLRLFNTRTSQLVLGAGAIHSSAKLKSINAKHLALVTQCLGMMIAILPHIRAALMAQLPSKQHLLLSDLDKVKQDYADHLEKVLTKFVTILGGIVEHSLAPLIVKTDFDQRAAMFSDEGNDKKPIVSCSPFLEGIVSNTRKMHQVLNSLLPLEHLRDVFSRIFLYLDQKIPLLYNSSAAASSKGNLDGSKPSFKFPTTDKGKQRMIVEVNYVIECLNSLPGVKSWKFTVASMLKKQLGMLNSSAEASPSLEHPDSENDTHEPEQGEDRDSLIVNSTENEASVLSGETSARVIPKESDIHVGDPEICKNSDCIAKDSESYVPIRCSYIANGSIIEKDQQKNGEYNGQDNTLSEF